MMAFTSARWAATEIENSPLGRAVRAGLTALPKRLPPWLFYDEAGSELFEKITSLPEYYLTRAERSIFAEHASECFSGFAGQSIRITELGAGSASKTQLILEALLKLQSKVVYEPVDVSPTALEQARIRMERDLPAVQVLSSVADFTRAFTLAPTSANQARLLLFIGSSIGNFDPPEANALLANVHAALRPGDCFLLGVDLVKDEKSLLAAYDDAAGVTAAFNKNLLTRLNRELGSNFDLQRFTHCALWNRAESRMEMHLTSCMEQTVHVPALNLAVHFAAGERMHTENSYKYQPHQAEQLLHSAGFEPLQCWMDERKSFAVLLSRAE